VSAVMSDILSGGLIDQDPALTKATPAF